MKKLFFIALTVLLCTLTSCSVYNRIGGNDLLFETLPKEALKILFPGVNFEADTVKALGNFHMNKIRAVLKKEKLRVFLTERADVTVDKADFFGTLGWRRISLDSVKINVKYNRKPYTPQYAPSKNP